MKQLDKLFINAQFHKGEESFTCIGVKDGLIEYIGDDYEHDDIVSKEIIDLGSKHIYPGFIDSHLHMLSYCWKQLYEVDLRHVKSSEELVMTVRKFIEENHIEDGQWIVGSGWNHEYFDDKKLPDRNLLDKISIVHPILLNRACYHLCVVNSLALEMAGISESAISVDGGAIDLVDNRPTGVLRENAETLVSDLLPSLCDKEIMKKLIIKGCKDLAKVGVTTVHTDDFSFVGDKAILLEAYKELALSHQLPINIVLQLRVSCVEEVQLFNELGLKSWMNYNKLRIGPVKIIEDGSLGARTAALSEPYSDDSKALGILVYDKKKLEDMVCASFDVGLDIAIHAIGDRTMNLILDIYEKYQSLIKQQEFRPSIIHCQIGSEGILERFKKLQVIANIQPIFLRTDWRMVEDRVGMERMKYSYCWKTYLDMGIPCAASSDAPIESFNPLLGVYCAVTRSDLSRKPLEGWMPEEKLSVIEGVKLYTEGSAYASKEENIKGSFRLGAVADFVVVSECLEEIDPHKIKDVEVTETYVDGELVNPCVIN